MWSRGTIFQSPSPSPPSGFICQGLREMGTRSPQLLPAAEGDRPHSVSHEIPELCSQNIPEFAPGLLVVAFPSLSPTDPVMSLHSDLGLPKRKEDRTKKKLPRLRGSKVRLISLERRGASSVYVQIAHNFPVR